MNRTPLTPDERDSLFFLVFLYMRIGRSEEAKLILTSLKRSCPEERRTGRYLAAIALEEEEGKAALAHLAADLSQSEIKPEDAPLLLMQAKAQWILGNENQSRAILKEYFALAGDSQ